ncbi:MAG: aldo/keto reductase [Eubacteriales bacterium]|nr:aldo/keto reductase [Eubacteriales bacterium]
MVYNALGKTGLHVSAVAFAGIVNMDETPQDAARYTAYAVEAGVNYFDVAPSYGNAEERLSAALLPYRSKVYLACKTQERGAAESREELLGSLKRLKTDHFDVYQLHAMSKPEHVERAFGKGGAMETMEWARREGLIRFIGFSAHNEDVALECLERFDFDTVMFPMNWAMGLTAGWGERIAMVVKQRGIGLIAIKTLISRKWREHETHDFPKSWCKPIWDNEPLAVAAMKYGLHKGAAILIPPGNINHQRFMVDHIDECVKNPLSNSEFALLRDEVEKVKDETIF